MNPNRINKENTTLATPTKSPFTYNGRPEEDLESFLTDIKRYITVNGYNAVQAMYLLRLSLTEEAGDWAKTKDEDTTFTDFVEDLTSRFQQEKSKAFYFQARH
ncbi:hypothetical protein GVAV_002032 [Gurleya vavrai]